MEYMVERQNNLGDLEEHVDRMLSEGWELQGGVSFANEGNLYYLQSLTRKTNDDKKENFYKELSELRYVGTETHRNIRELCERLRIFD